MTDESAYDRLVEGLQYLSRVCDGALSLDGEGFSGADSVFGKSLADQTLTGSLSEKQALWGCKMIQKYRKQCAKVGIDVPTYQEIKIEVNTDVNAEIKVIGRIELIEAYGEQKIAVSFRFDAKLVTQIKACGPRERINGYFIPSWDKQNKRWLFPFQHVYLDELIEKFPEFVVDAQIAATLRAEALDAEVEQEIREHELKAKLDILGDLTQPTGPGKITFFEHQIEGIKWLVERNRVILADDMGLGKTYIALQAAKAYGVPIFVICPASLRINWEREAYKINVRIETFTWAKLPLPLQLQEYVLIGDEMHYAQNYRSKRTQAFLSLALDKNCKAIFGLTGTPMKNGRPSNIFPLLAAVQHPLGANRSAFEKRYCAAGMRTIVTTNQQGQRLERRIWDNTGAAHLDELHQLTKNAMLRRTKAQCLDMPEKIRTLRQTELTNEEHHAYIEMFEELRNTYLERLRKGEIMEGAEALVLINHLRRAGSTAKVRDAFEMCEELIEQGYKVGCGFAYKDSAHTLQDMLTDEGYSTWILSGDTPPKDRQGLVDDFQKGLVDVGICTFGAGGVGITLTEASHCILIDRPWTPGDAVQYEDRFHRIGQNMTVNCHWLQLAGIPYIDADGVEYDIGVDAWIDNILLAKQERINLVLEGKRKTMRGIASIEHMALEVINNMMRQEKAVV